jgi:hypothetical protein
MHTGTMMGSREFLQQPGTFKNQKIGGFYLSRHIHGQRCLWDGGLSRGVKTISVPWSGITNPETGELKDLIPESTGLWNERGEPVEAPDSLLDRLPPFPCDGVLSLHPAEFAVFSSPPLRHLFQTGRISNDHMIRAIEWPRMKRWLDIKSRGTTSTGEESTFCHELFAMAGWAGWDEIIYMINQRVLPKDDGLAKLYLENIENMSNELILRDPSSQWRPRVSLSYLKVTK